tara:strand:- start:979 stop:1131 length:153 start_codon:yes stop_codon:yes gene_type:complete
MVKGILQAIGIFILIYIVWLNTGGPERGMERAATGEDSIFIGIPQPERDY